ncbi:MAG TPA: sigma-70 family RNA polymerase sigma factor [Acidimicrobiia bacterium]|nr:sigma-70 family RNA polymerase sigma factor [Acidimicrobiia bacterium]
MGREEVADFSAFFAAEYRTVVGLAFVLCGRLDAAEDLAQDAFAAAFHDWNRIARYDDPGAWVRRVVANRAVSLRRRRSSEGRLVERLASLAPGAAAEPPLIDPELGRAIRSLSRRQAQIVALVYFEDLSVARSAEILGCSEETSRTHLRRARAALARRLGMRQEEEPA